MQRRLALKVLAGIGITGTASTIAWHGITPANSPLTLKQVLKDLERIKNHPISLNTSWSLAQTLIHCAQSIEYSMTGFPEHHSPLFKNSIGKLAFSAFYTKGKMTHPLDEAIPGAPALDSNVDLELAFNRFIKSLTDFDEFQGELAPHFAYGKLSKHEYEVAHVMHFNNHFQSVLHKS